MAALPEPALVPVGPADLQALERLVRAYYLEDRMRFGRPQARALRALFANDSPGFAWFVALAGESVGYAVLALGFSLESGGRDGLIDELYLKPEVRGRGIGGQVLALIEQEARRLGLGKLYLEVAHGNRAIDLYRRAGFVDHRRYLMSKPL